MAPTLTDITPENATETTSTPPATETSPAAPKLDPEEQARRERVVARRLARQASEDAARLADEGRRAAMRKLDALLGRGSAIPMKKIGSRADAASILAAIEAAREHTDDVQVTITIPSTTSQKGRRQALRLSPKTD